MLKSPVLNVFLVELQQQLRNRDHFVKFFSCTTSKANSRRGSSCNSREYILGNKSSNKTTPSKRLSRYSASTIMGSKGNRFSFADYDCIGFDLDGTLLRYNLPEMIPLEYNCLANSLVRKGYPSGALKQPIETDFLQKGLILDAVRGNILKLNPQGRIVQARHGTRLLSDCEIIAAYGDERTWSISSEFIEDPLSTWNGPASEQMRTLLDYFDMPASLILGRAVDAIDAKGPTADYQVWPDILDGLYDMYKRDYFENGSSEYFAALKEDPQRYILKTNPKVIEWLKELRRAGKAVYLLTGSNVDFANLTASYALGENWRELFDCVVCFARKPGFFAENRPFFDVQGLAEADEHPANVPLELNQVYSQGNWAELKELLAKKVGKDLDQLRSLYVGDNLIQDVYTPSCVANMDTIAISEEMHIEGCAGVENGLHGDYKKILESSTWNSYFVHNECPTLWLHVIQKYSKLCVPTVDYLTNCSIDEDFICDNGVFYPAAPSTKE